jgi:dienelactone hydrolase
VRGSGICRTTLEFEKGFRGALDRRGVRRVSLLSPCNTVYIDDEDVGHRPIRVFHGTGDHYVERYVERLGKARDLKEYAGAGHVFDNPRYSLSCFLPDAVTGSKCLWQERLRGDIVDARIGQPFAWSNPCMRRGASVTHDAAATADAIEAVTSFLARCAGSMIWLPMFAPSYANNN